MSIKVYIMTHKNFDKPTDPMYIPLQVGKAKATPLNYIGDNTGENISELNCYYSELTGIYWVWKNVHDMDYVGICHYRRYLINYQGFLFSGVEYEQLLKNYDMITTKRVQLNNSYHYGFAANHNVKVLDETGKVIKEKYPEYYSTFLKLVNGRETYFGNIMVCSKKIFDKYAEWLFDIFFEVQQRVNLASTDDYHRRVFGFISEFLLYVWAKRNQLKVYECKVGMLGEKAETRELKNKLAEFFLHKDIEGAKKHFLEVQKVRPDVLMEASDITGELKLSMQIIATCSQEQIRYQSCLLDRINQFDELMNYFSMLNRVVSKDEEELNTEEKQFINTQIITPVAFEIAKRISAAINETKER